MIGRSPRREWALDSSPLPKIEAIAFGFLVPIFFIVTGINFDLQALIKR